MEKTFVGGFSVGGERLAGTLVAWSVVLSVLALIVSIVLIFVFKSKIIDKFEQYVDIPNMLCHYTKDKSQADNATRADLYYMYYRAARNPFPNKVATKSLQDQADLEPNPLGIQDVFNWEMGKDTREWLAIYATKDERAGYPIRANSLKVVSETASSNRKYAEMFNVSGFYNISGLYNYNLKIDNSISGSDRDTRKQTDRYIEFNVDTTAKRTSSSLVGSAVSNGFTWGLFVIGIGLGGVGAYFLTRHLLLKKKEKE